MELFMRRILPVGSPVVERLALAWLAEVGRWFLSRRSFGDSPGGIREELRRTGWFSYRNMCGDPDPGLVTDVLAEIRERGPILTAELTDRGILDRNYDHPWARKTTVNMVCVDVLHARCDVVVVERTGGASGLT